MEERIEKLASFRRTYDRFSDQYQVDFSEIRSPDSPLLKEAYSVLKNYYGPKGQMQDFEEFKDWVATEAKKTEDDSDYSFNLFIGQDKLGKVVYVETSDTLITDWNIKRNTIFHPWAVVTDDVPEKYRTKVLHTGWHYMIEGAERNVKEDDGRCVPHILFTEFDPTETNDYKHLLDIGATVPTVNGKVLTYHQTKTIGLDDQSLIPIVMELKKGKFPDVHEWLALQKHRIMDELEKDDYDAAFEETYDWEADTNYQKVLADLAEDKSSYKYTKIDLVPLLKIDLETRTVKAQ
jgi:hypothetical protein